MNKAQLATARSIVVAIAATLAVISLFWLSPEELYSQNLDIDSQNPVTEGLETSPAPTVKPPSEDEAAELPPQLSYDFEAVECDGLTHLVRKSLLLFDQANDALSLSKEGIIYAETNIVQKLGERLLEVGESVSIDATLVEEFALKSQDLSDEQVAAWAGYIEGVDFELERINPLQHLNESTDENDGQPPADVPASTTENNTPDQTDQASGIWWLAGGVAVIGLWYLLYRRSDD